jgi:hypothetical protein
MGLQHECKFPSKMHANIPDKVGCDSRFSLTLLISLKKNGVKRNYPSYSTEEKQKT